MKEQVSLQEGLKNNKADDVLKNGGLCPPVGDAHHGDGGYGWIRKDLASMEEERGENHWHVIFYRDSRVISRDG